MPKLALLPMEVCLSVTELLTAFISRGAGLALLSQHHHAVEVMAGAGNQPSSPLALHSLVFNLPPSCSFWDVWSCPILCHGWITSNTASRGRQGEHLEAPSWSRLAVTSWWGSWSLGQITLLWQIWESQYETWAVAGVQSPPNLQQRLASSS